MTENFSKSFNEEFCTTLEYTLCSIFSNCKDEELKGFWCDGVSWAPYFNPEVNRDYLSIEKVKERQDIETSARMGISGQDEYEMKILLGENSLRKYLNSESLIDCIPSWENNDWVEIDTIECKIEINLL